MNSESCKSTVELMSENKVTESEMELRFSLEHLEESSINMKEVR